MDEPDAKTGHPDAAGWVLGVLDPEDTGRFEVHLQSCDECQQAVSEFGPASQLLKTALPAIELMATVEPPADLEARTLAKVEQASRKLAWRRRSTRLITAAAVVIIVVVVAVTVSLTQSSAPALAFSLPLHALDGTAAAGEATAHQSAGGFSIQLSVRHLVPLPPGSFYECWYAGPSNGPGHPDLITAGTFVVDSSGNATVQMWSAADPRSFPTMEITAEQPGDATQHGSVVLAGTARR